MSRLLRSQYGFGATRTLNVSKRWPTSLINLRSNSPTFLTISLDRGLQSGQFIDGVALQVPSPTDFKVKFVSCFPPTVITTRV